MEEKDFKKASLNIGSENALQNSFIVKQDLNLCLMSYILDFLEAPEDEECASLLKALKARLLRLSVLPVSAEIVGSYVALECVPEVEEEED